MIATGLTNIPHLPSFQMEKGHEFTPPIIHSKYLAQKSELLLFEAVQKVVVSVSKN
jgi:hypothetical protein